MTQTPHPILRQVRHIIKDVCDRRALNDDPQAPQLLAGMLPREAGVLRTEAETVYEMGEPLAERFYGIYLRALLWALAEHDRPFVARMAKNVFAKEYITDKDPWINLLEWLNERETVALFFKDNPRYGDRYDQEKLLYILSDTQVDIGDRILDFLHSPHEILASAALTVLEDQHLTRYLPQLRRFFQDSHDPDLLVESATLLLKWDDTFRTAISPKMEELRNRNATYYADAIEELGGLI